MKYHCWKITKKNALKKYTPTFLKAVISNPREKISVSITKMVKSLSQLLYFIDTVTSLIDPLQNWAVNYEGREARCEIIDLIWSIPFDLLCCEVWQCTLFSCTLNGAEIKTFLFIDFLPPRFENWTLNIAITKLSDNQVHLQRDSLVSSDDDKLLAIFTDLYLFIFIKFWGHCVTSLMQCFIDSTQYTDTAQDVWTFCF